MMRGCDTLMTRGCDTLMTRGCDRIGRRPLILLCLYAGTGGSILKYVLRESFWGFCGANFLNGCFASTMPVGYTHKHMFCDYCCDR